MKFYFYFLLKRRQKEIASAFHTGTSVKGLDKYGFEEQFKIGLCDPLIQYSQVPKVFGDGPRQVSIYLGSGELIRDLPHIRLS